jgi:hypothetical protein
MEPYKKQDLQTEYEFDKGTFKLSVTGEGLTILAEFDIEESWPRAATIGGIGTLLQQIGLSLCEIARKPAKREVDVTNTFANRHALVQTLRRRPYGRNRR